MAHIIFLPIRGRRFTQPSQQLLLEVSIFMMVATTLEEDIRRGAITAREEIITNGTITTVDTTTVVDISNTRRAMEFRISTRSHVPVSAGIRSTVDILTGFKGLVMPGGILSKILHRTRYPIF
jgi:hypothetical protein